MKSVMNRICSVLLILMLAGSAFACTVKIDTPAVSEATSTPESKPTDAPEASDASAVKTADPTEAPAREPVRIGALAGPTGVGLTYVMQDTDRYAVDIFTAPDQLSPKFIKGEVDIAAVPINLASVLYNKTDGEAVVIAVNTLGVLYFLENGTSVQSILDLAGKTVYSTGQGSTPEYVLSQILSQNGLSEKVTVEFLADNAELIAKLASGEAEIALLPEPHVSIACTKSESIRVALSANDLWKENNDAALVQGVYIVRKSYLEEHKAEVDQFLSDAKASSDRVKTDENAADDVVAQGIIGAVPIAKRAIPNCNIVLETGSSMKRLVSGMLETLYNANPASVGGSLPNADFYYEP